MAKIYLTNQNLLCSDCRDRDSLDDLADSIGCSSPEDVYAMIDSYALYCDAAGGEDHGFIVVAGYLSTLSKWRDFAEDWKYLLATYDLPYFHMKEFAQSKGPFVSWKDDEPKRARFLSKAAMIIQQNVQRGFAHMVEFDLFNRLDKRFCLTEHLGCPYSLAAMSCAARARKILRRNDVTYIFEDGDKGKGYLMRLMEAEGFPAPVFRPSRDQKRKHGIVKGVIQLQAADFAAYELRKVFKDDPNEVWPLEKYRKSLHALSQVCSKTEYNQDHEQASGNASQCNGIHAPECST
jgi:hypothetical protein